MQRSEDGDEDRAVLPTKMLPKEMERYRELLSLAQEAEGSLKKVMDGLPR